jgi:NAD+ dependent glucose-6-phosphate dehydrogenase
VAQRARDDGEAADRPQRPAPPRIVLVGGSGVVGQILSRHLRATHDLLVLDPKPPADRTLAWKAVSAAEVTPSLLRRGDAVCFLATGGEGWDGLLETEIVGLRRSADAAADVGAHRFVFASSNHAVGGYERDLMRHGYDRADPPCDLMAQVRPDSDYGVAKAFGEAHLRYLAEEGRLAVSILRIGTVRTVDDPDAAVRGGEADFLPLSDERRRRRFRASWLSHPDLVRIVDEELASSTRFRRRFAVSNNPGRFWPLNVEEWGDV